METNRREEVEQKLIEHEVRLSRAREAGELYVAGRDARQDERSGMADRRWYREQLISMLKEARTAEDLEGLGLSDAVVREARLGETLRDAWMRFHPPPPDSPDRPSGASRSRRPPPARDLAVATPAVKPAA